MYSIGIDLGTRNTAIAVVHTMPEGGPVLEEPRLFTKRRNDPKNYSAELAEWIRNEASKYHGEQGCIAIDCPMMVGSIRRRDLEKTFQRGMFSNGRNKTAIQPNNPQGIQDTVELCLDLRASLQGDFVWRADPEKPQSTTSPALPILEVFPTLSLGLLAEPDFLIERRKVHRLYHGKSYALMRALEGARDSGKLSSFLGGRDDAFRTAEMISNRWTKDHVAAAICGYLGFHYMNGNGIVCLGSDGHYVLPPRHLWHRDWVSVLENEPTHSVTFTRSRPSQ